MEQQQNLALAAAQFAASIDVQDMHWLNLSSRTHGASLGIFHEIV
jgi:hypothetical protein